MNTFKLTWINAILIFLISSLLTSIHAKTKNSATLSGFNSKNAFYQLKSIEKQITAKPKDLELKKTAVNKLERLQSQAETCIKNANEQLTTLNNVLKNLQSLGEQTNIQKIEDFKYFATQKNNYIGQAITCQKFIFQSEETLGRLNENIQKITTQIKLYRATPIWTILGMTPKLFAELNAQKFYQSSGLASFTINLIAFLFMTILAFLLSAFFIRKKCSNWLSQKQERKKYSIALLTITKKYIFPLFLLGGIFGYLTTMFSSFESKPLIETISHILLAYLAALAILDFSSLLPSLANKERAQNSNRIFFVRANFLLTLLTAATILAILFSSQDTILQLKYIAISYFYFLLGIIVTWKSWPIISSFISTFIHKKASAYFKYTLIIILSSSFFIQTLGYYQLSLHIIYGFLFIPLTLIIFYFIGKILNSTEGYLNGEKGGNSIKIRRFLGLKYNKKITEFILIKISAYLLAAYLLGLVLLDVFRLPSIYIDKINKIFMHGFVLVNIKIVPFQFVLAMLAFAITFIFGRWVTNIITKKRSLQSESDIQNVMASLLSYVSFCISFIIAMIIAGVDFTGLTVIVGALSVGIGLGLQNIVNNFISGIILLAEKSIKPGDRIIINDKEGFVKEIRLRSTQITTLAKEDIIVPNSDFITQQVINYTFKDELARVACKVGVSYDSDVDLVEKTLIEIAEKHPDVKHDEANKPAVLFKEFADSSLNFALYCTINDANKRYRVISDLNTTVFKEFKKLGIEIAYPQLDVHMK